MRQLWWWNYRKMAGINEDSTAGTKTQTKNTYKDENESFLCIGTKMKNNYIYRDQIVYSTYLKGQKSTH